MYIPNIAALSIVQSPVPPEEYVIAGFYSEGDGGGGTFVWIENPSPNPSANPLPVDYGITFPLPSDNNNPGKSGHFKRIYSGPINVRWFGAIMGADDPNPPVVQIPAPPGSPCPPITRNYPNTITDVTPYVHRARDSRFARNGTLYFPADFDDNNKPKPYVGAFEFLHAHGEVNLLGDGWGTVLKSNGDLYPDPSNNCLPNPNDPKPVLRLGWKAQHWRHSKVSNIVVEGRYNTTFYFTDGVVFDDDTSSELAGRWVFEQVTFRYCKKGVFKKHGNIGNVYDNCLFLNNNFGYYAVSTGAMHSGSDQFRGGHVEQNDHAGLFVKGDGLYGQLIVDGTVIEGNPGFGIYIKLTTSARLTFNAVEIRNVWMEGNAYPFIYGALISQPVIPDLGAVSGFFNPQTSSMIIGGSINNTTSSPTAVILYAGSTQVAILNFISSGTGWIILQQSIPLNSAQINSMFSGAMTVKVTMGLAVENSIATLQLTPQTLIIDGETIDCSDYRTLRFEGVRSVEITGANITDISLIESSASLENCRSDRHFTETNYWPYRVDVDEKSQLQANNFRYGNFVSEKILVNSISYDGSADILNNNSSPTSVWGPLRCLLIKEVFEALPYLVKYGNLLDNASTFQFASVASQQSQGGVLGAYCCKLLFQPNQTAVLNLGFVPEQDKYYMWSMHGMLDFGNVYGSLRINNPGNVQQFGQLILKPGQWVCSYGIRKYTGNTTNTMTLEIKNQSSTDRAYVFIADVQVLEFRNYADAISYAQSRVFTLNNKSKPGFPISTGGATFRWMSSTGTFEIENAYNIQVIRRISTGLYYIQFDVPLNETPIVQVTPETLEGEKGDETAIVATYEDASVNGVQVRLVQVINGRPTPVDNSFSLLVA